MALSNRSVKTILAANPLILIFLAYCLFSLLWSDYPFVVLKRWIRSVGDIVVILVIITEPRWRTRSGGSSNVSVLSWFRCPFFLSGFIPLGRAYSRGGVPEWTGVGTDKNALGMLCMIYGASLLWHGIATYKSRASKQRRRQLWGTGIVFAMILYLLAVVDSKTALACFMMASTLIILTASVRAFRKPALVSLVVVGMLGASFCVLFLGVGGGALSAIGRDASLTGRTDVWKTVLPYDELMVWGRL